MTVRPHVIFVDDEPHVLSALRRMLRDRREHWDMTFAVGAREALGALSEGQCTVVISDYRMPELDGGVLLQILQERYPGTIRMILSGHTDEVDLFKVLLLAHAFLNKPCPRDEIVEAVDGVVRMHPTRIDHEIDRMLPGWRQLPGEAGSVHRLLSALDSSDRSPGALSAILARDHRCASAILATANSAAFAVSGTVRPDGPIREVSDAVALLGIRNVRALAVMSDLVHLVGEHGDPLAHWAARRYRNARAAAELARQLAGTAPWADDAFAAGLLYDVGQLALAACRPAEFGEYLTRRAGSPDADGSDGAGHAVTHASIGAHLLRHWGVGLPVIEAVAAHQPAQPVPHTPNVGSVAALAHAVVETEFGALCDLVSTPVTWAQLGASAREATVRWRSGWNEEQMAA